MALINCSECGNMVSSMAAACPRCGCPVSKMTLKSRFYFEIDKNIFEDCFPIILKVGSKEFRINSFWRGKGCICAAEVFSNEAQTTDVEICYTFIDPAFSGPRRRTIEFNGIMYGKNYLFNCESETIWGEGEHFFDCSSGVKVTASCVNDDTYNNIPLADLS